MGRWPLTKAGKNWLTRAGIHWFWLVGIYGPQVRIFGRTIAAMIGRWRSQIFHHILPQSSTRILAWVGAALDPVLAPLKPRLRVYLPVLRQVWDIAFRERQIHLRSHGRVRFVRLDAGKQVVIAAVALSVIGFFGFSVYAQFEHAQLKQQYAATKDLFQNTLTSYEVKYQQLETLLDKETIIDRKYDELQALFVDSLKPFLSRGGTGKTKTVQRTRVEENEFGTTIITAFRELTLDLRRSRTDQPVLASLGSHAGFKPPSLEGGLLDDYESPLLNKVNRLELAQRELLNQAEEVSETRIKNLTRTVQSLGLTPARLLNAVNAEYGQGGPLLRSELDLADRIAEDKQFFRVSNNLKRIQELEAVFEMTPVAHPLSYGYRTTSGFGYRRDPITNTRSFHAGIDFAGSIGLKVFAAASGTIKHAEWMGGYGRVIDIDHGNGLATRYSHLHKFLVEPGDKIEQGQVIALMGNSGRSTGPHLHYEVWVDGKPHNPGSFIKAGNYVLKK